MGLSVSRTAMVLRLAFDQGNAKRQSFRVPKKKYGKSTRDYWWVKGASEMLAREGRK